MPFVDQKDDDSGMMTQVPELMGTDHKVLWEGDVYRPSSALDKALSLGAPASPVLIAQARGRVCGNAECSGGWKMPWRNRRRPIFEGQWGCSGRCVLAMVQAAVRRERGSGTPAATAVHRHRVPIGLVMLAQGWINQTQLRQALETQRSSGTGRIGEWLVRESGVEPEQVTRALSMQWKCPVLSVDDFSTEAMALVMPRLFVEEFGILPLRIAGSRILYLAFEDHLDASAAFAMEQMTRLTVESGFVETSRFRSAQTRLMECSTVAAKLENVADADTLAARITGILEQKQPIAARLVRMHQYYWLRIWLENGSMGKSGSLPVTGEDVNDHIFSF
jgi:hypothetical protein